jgi:hypothetical protein
MVAREFGLLALGGQGLSDAEAIFHPVRILPIVGSRYGV